jgi:hypothetical protein
MDGSWRGRAPVVIAASAAISGAAALCVLLGAIVFPKGPAALIELLREGGSGVWAVLAVSAITIAVSTGLSIWFTSSERAPAWWSVLFPYSVVSMGVLFDESGFSRVTHAIGTASLDADQRFRVLAQAISELTTVSLVASLSATAVLSSLSLVFGARALSRVSHAAFGPRAIGALAMGTAGLVSVGGYALVRSGAGRVGFGFGWLAALAGCAAAWLAGMALGDDSADEAAKARAFGDLSIATLYALSAVILAAIAVHGREYRALCGALSGASLDAEQRVRIASGGVSALQEALVAQLIWVAPGLLASLGAAISGRQLAVAGARRELSALTALGLFALMSPVALLGLRSHHEGALAAITKDGPTSETSLVDVHRAVDQARGARMTVTQERVSPEGRDIARTESLADAESCNAAMKQLENESPARLSLAVDGAVRFKTIACLLSTKIFITAPRREVRFLVQKSFESDASAPWNGRFVSTGSAIVKLIDTDAPVTRDHLHVGADGWWLKLGDTKTELSTDDAARLATLSTTTLPGRLGLSFERDVSMSTVLSVLALASPRTLILDLAHTKEEVLAAGSAQARHGNLDSPGENAQGYQAKSAVVRGGNPAVLGHLPPDVVLRIVRPNLVRARLCYEEGLKRNPSLAGRIAVRLIVSQDGKVASSGDGGSDVPDATVLGCVIRSFASLAFPPPDSGIVNVTYPISFSPGP